MTTEVTHLFLLFSEDQSEVCQPSISHSAHDPVSSRLSPIQMLGLRAFSGLSQACALWMGCLAPTLGCFPQRIWVMTWTNNKMFVWTALLWKSCSGVLMIHPNYYHFSAKLANNKLSCLVLFIILMRRSPHLSQTTEEIKEWKEPNWGTQCDLSSKAKICPRKFQPKWESGTENTTCLRIGWLENICHLDKQWEKLNKKSAKRQERVKIWFNCFTCSSRHQ